MDRQRRDFGRLNVAILAREGKGFRKVAWIVSGHPGVQFGVAREDGLGTRYDYRADGNLYRVAFAQTPRGPTATQQLIARHPPLRDIRGLEQIISAEAAAGDRLRGFPFRRGHESVAVRPSEGKVSFNLGLLQPNVPEALSGLERGKGVHFRLITRTVPWIVLWNRAGFEIPLSVSAR